MEKNNKIITSSQLLPGFRFHPSDEELVMHYLINKASSRPLPAHIIADVELYKLDPWDLPKRAVYGDEEWYFFTPRERKYPNGERPNRTAASGYWKATGTDKPIMTACGGGKVIGLKKALVFYKGKPPKGLKTDWIMHEYRLPLPTNTFKKLKGSMRLDDWVLCRVWHKSNNGEDAYGVGKSILNITTQTLPSNNWQLQNHPNHNLPFLFGFQQHFHYSNCMDNNNAVSSLSTASQLSGQNSHEAENVSAALLSNGRKRKLFNGGQNQQDIIHSDNDNNKVVNFDGDFTGGDTPMDQLWDILLQY